MQKAVSKVLAQEALFEAVALESAALTQAASFDALVEAAELTIKEAHAAQVEAEEIFVVSAVVEGPHDATPAQEADESFKEAEVSVILLKQDE